VTLLFVTLGLALRVLVGEDECSGESVRQPAMPQYLRIVLLLLVLLALILIALHQ
jgi:predicted secreted protein